MNSKDEKHCVSLYMIIIYSFEVVILEVKVVQCFLLHYVVFNCQYLVQAEIFYAWSLLQADYKKKTPTTLNQNPRSTIHLEKKFSALPY